MPHVTPVGWGLGSDQSPTEIGGHDLTATKKFRDIERVVGWGLDDGAGTRAM